MLSSFSSLDAAADVSIGQPVRQRSAEPIDLKHLGRYTLGDANLEYEVLGLFAGQMPETIRALKAAASERDWFMAAHTLKGSGRAVGAWRLADLAQQAESIGVSADRSAAAAIVRQIEAAAAEIASYVGAMAQPRTG